MCIKLLCVTYLFYTNQHRDVTQRGALNSRAFRSSCTTSEVQSISVGVGRNNCKRSNKASYHSQKTSVDSNYYISEILKKEDQH